MLLSSFEGFQRKFGGAEWFCPVVFVSSFDAQFVRRGLQLAIVLLVGIEHLGIKLAEWELANEHLHLGKVAVGACRLAEVSYLIL